MKLKLIEQFSSLQGEGRFVGVPSIFLRTFGCNFTCAGFGLPPGERSTEPDEIAAMVKADPVKYSSLESIPIASTGCDSYVSWHPAFKNHANNMEVRDIVEWLRSQLPNGKFSRDFHLIITGGEPLLGWQRSYPELLDMCRRELELTNVTFETNGTQKLRDELKMFLHNTWINIHWSVSPKLSASGESWKSAIIPGVVAEYARYGILDFKFVVDSEEHLHEVGMAMAEYQSYGVDYESVYLMPEGGRNELYQKNSRRVADLAVKYGYRYSPRLQNDLYNNEWAT